MDGDLIYRDEAIEALNLTTDIKGNAYRELHDRLIGLATVAVKRKCTGCMGAAFNDCPTCEPVKETEE